MNPEIHMETEARKRKLRFRAAHRGMKELDLYVGAFAEARVERMTDIHLDEFEAILDLPDTSVLDWVTGRAPPPVDAGPVLVDLLNFDYFNTTRNASISLDD